jgi:hypothetical protein
MRRVVEAVTDEAMHIGCVMHPVLEAQLLEVGATKDEQFAISCWHYIETLAVLGISLVSRVDGISQLEISLETSEDVHKV